MCLNLGRRSKNNRGDSKVEGNNKKGGEGGGRNWLRTIVSSGGSGCIKDLFKKGEVCSKKGWMPERGDVRMGSDPLESMHCYEEITDEQFSRLQRSVFKVRLMSCVAKN